MQPAAVGPWNRLARLEVRLRGVRLPGLRYEPNVALSLASQSPLTVGSLALSAQTIPPVTLGKAIRHSCCSAFWTKRPSPSRWAYRRRVGLKASVTDRKSAYPAHGEHKVHNNRAEQGGVIDSAKYNLRPAVARRGARSPSE